MEKIKHEIELHEQKYRRLNKNDIMGEYCLVRQYIERRKAGWEPVAYSDDKIFLVPPKE